MQLTEGIRKTTNNIRNGRLDASAILRGLLKTLEERNNLDEDDAEQAAVEYRESLFEIETFSELIKGFPDLTHEIANFTGEFS